MKKKNKEKNKNNKSKNKDKEIVPSSSYITKREKEIKKGKKDKRAGKYLTSYSSGRTDLRAKKYSLHWAREPSRTGFLDLEEQLLFNGVKRVRFKLPTHRRAKKSNPNFW